MKITIFSFSSAGEEAAEKMCKELDSADFRGETIVVGLSCDKDYVEEAWKTSDALVFVCASGIATRLIAPYIEDKLKDPAVIVCDEKMQFVIPVLSGHVGGANELSKIIASNLMAIPVITTATDVQGVVAFDELAAVNGLEIKNRNNIKKVSSGLMNRNPINVAIADDVIITANENDVDDLALGLIYRPIVVGIGCRKNKSFEEINDFFLESIKNYDVDIEKIIGIATIDIKASEPGLLKLSELYHIPITTFSSDELEKVEGEFEASEFVKETVGVSDVSARAAKALGKNGKFLLKKEKKNGMTISIFEKYRRLTFNYEKA